MTIRAVAKIMGCAPGSVARWDGLYEAQGARGLDPIPNAGGTPRLKPKEKALLKRMVIAGPRAYGYDDGVWTLRRVRDLISQRFDVEYHIGHVHRLMIALGFSAQKPQVRALERDELAIERFRRRGWAKVKKRLTSGRNARVDGREWIHAAAVPGAHLGAARTDPDAALLRPPRPIVGD
jgi:transposase